MQKRFLFITVLLFCLGSVARPETPNLSTLIQEQVDRANAKLERMREAYAKGAISRRELEQAEEEARDAERRLQDASQAGKPLGPEGARRRVEDARHDYEKAAAKASKLAELYAAGVVSRNEAESAKAAADQAETWLKLNEHLAQLVEAAANAPRPKTALPGSGGFSIQAFFQLQDDYLKEFHQALPVSAFGPSETHEKLGFDHDGRVDIALNPDSTEGRWLVAQLELRGIPFIAFRHAVTGKATGAHIHMGFPSPVISSAANGG